MNPFQWQSKWRYLEQNGILVPLLDYGGTGPAVLLLGGHARDPRGWDQTAKRLTQACRVVAFQSGRQDHGDRARNELSTAMLVRDTVFVIEQLKLMPVVLVGRAQGAPIALLVAKQRPELVSGLFVTCGGKSHTLISRTEVGALVNPEHPSS
jgi:pimeloyl-ACP methyl ester carboxylesterase